MNRYLPLVAAAVLATACQARPPAPAPQSVSRVATTSVAPTPSVRESSPASLLDITGNGTFTSYDFTAPDVWVISYSFDCAANTVGAGQGNFIILLGGNGAATNTLPVNDNGASGKRTVVEHGAGYYKLTMITPCRWAVSVTG